MSKIVCLILLDNNSPYCLEDYLDAFSKGLDLDSWIDFETYYELGEINNY